ncbi:DUF4123 domain-containing protein [Pseudomonas sp. CrR25]|nr:DUF4123 domain-containing protein [Pseudomonas sp. CrR25]
MHSSERPLISLPSDLPWSMGAYLILDGVSVEALPKKLYGWSDTPDFEVLYLETRWAELGDLSPCLIHLSGPHDPICGQFLNHAAEEWGYLLFSQASRLDVLAHVRQMISVRHPLGSEMLLRLADPAVAQALFALAEEEQNTALFGPIEQLYTPDAVIGRWHSLRRPGQSWSPRPAPYRLSDSELARLGDVDFRQTVLRLDKHMHEYFPAYGNALTGTARWEHLHALALAAYQTGFSSEREITLYANIFGFLGEQALAGHPDIAALLRETTSQSPAQRVEQAAELAAARAPSSERNSL